LVSRRSSGSRVTWAYHEGEPMATYLATATIGQFKVDTHRIAGLPSVVAVDPRVAKGSQDAIDKMGKMLRLERSLFGPYPFATTGVIVDDAPSVGYALETQTRPLFDQV